MRDAEKKLVKDGRIETLRVTPPFFDSFGDVSFRVLCLLRSGSFVSIYLDVLADG